MQGNDLEKIKEVVAMTRLGQIIYEDGVKAGEERGREEGRKEGSARMTALMKALLASSRLADLQLALDDPVYREKLMEEYGIK